MLLPLFTDGCGIGRLWRRISASVCRAVGGAPPQHKADVPARGPFAQRRGMRSGSRLRPSYSVPYNLASLHCAALRDAAVGGTEAVMAPDIGQSTLLVRPPSCALLVSPFSPVFDLELECRRAGASSAGFPRCSSEQAFRADEGGAPSLMQQVLGLCRPSSPVAAQLLQQLTRLRAAFATSGGGSGGAARGASPPLRDDPKCSGSEEWAAPAGRSPSPPAGNAPPGQSSLDVEAMACELLAAGYLVQVRDGAQQSDRTRSARSCLQTLRHRFIVCLGWRDADDAEPAYLPEPLVVEPRFREQFLIAHPTPEYAALLAAVPQCFVGPPGVLEAAVKLLCEQMVAAFKAQGLPVPPWRTRQALLSKWSLAQLAELAAKIASLRRLSVDARGVSGQNLASVHASHERLCNGDRPAATRDHAAVGSAPPGAAAPGGARTQDVQAAAADAAAAAGPAQLTPVQLLEIMPPDMQRVLGAQLAVGGLSPTGGRPAASGRCAPLPLAPGTAAAAAAVGPPPGQPDHTQAAALPLCGIAAVAAPGQGGGTLSATPPVRGAVPGLPSGEAVSTAATGPPPRPPPSPHSGGGAAAAASAAGGVLVGTSPAADVLALLQATESSGAQGIGGGLKFTRKASAEWKHQRAVGRKMRGLLAAALKKPAGSRSNLVHSPVQGGAPQAPHGQQHDGSGSSDGLALATRVAGPSTGAPVAPLLPSARGDERTAEPPLIRRTHYRPCGDEPWRRITTVRWGAYATGGGTPPPAAAAAPLPQQQQQQQQQ